jgi:hypothetical protein
MYPCRISAETVIIGTCSSRAKRSRRCGLAHLNTADYNRFDVFFLHILSFIRSTVGTVSRSRSAGRTTTTCHIAAKTDIISTVSGRAKRSRRCGLSHLNTADYNRFDVFFLHMLSFIRSTGGTVSRSRSAGSTTTTRHISAKTVIISTVSGRAKRSRRCGLSHLNTADYNRLDVFFLHFFSTLLFIIRNIRSSPSVTLRSSFQIKKG